MVLESFSIIQGDMWPPIITPLLRGDDSAINLTDKTVKFNMRGRYDSTPTIDRASVVINNPTSNEVQYNWAAGNTDTAGEFYGQFVVLDGSGNQYCTVPNDGYITITIIEKLD